MILEKCIGGTPNPAWRDLVEELDRWGAAGRVAALWWRDDDAVTASAALADLLSLADGIPLVLAVIPAEADRRLAPPLARHAGVAVAQHGWRHANHASGNKKSEFPDSRNRDDVAADLAAGRDRLRTLFGGRAWPVLVPPWNRFSAAFLSLLPQVGFRGLSRISPRFPAPPRREEQDVRDDSESPRPRPARSVCGIGPGGRGVAEADVHVDLVDWKGSRGFIGEAAALGGLVAHLGARRCAEADPGKAVGILTHHRVMDAASRDFLDRLTRLIAAHRAARWVDAAELFGIVEPAKAASLP